MLEESKKEYRYVKERNQEMERVVEALRKTIMRQAELSSQRQDHHQQGQSAEPRLLFRSADISIRRQESRQKKL